MTQFHPTSSDKNGRNRTATYGETAMVGNCRLPRELHCAITGNPWLSCFTITARRLLECRDARTEVSCHVSQLAGSCILCTTCAPAGWNGVYHLTSRRSQVWAQPGGEHVVRRSDFFQWRSVPVKAHDVVGCGITCRPQSLILSNCAQDKDQDYAK